MSLCPHNYHKSSFFLASANHHSLFCGSSYLHHGLHLTIISSVSLTSSSSSWKPRPEAHPTHCVLPFSCSKSAPRDPQNTPPALTARPNCYQHNPASFVETKTGRTCCMAAGEDRRRSLDTDSDPLISSLPCRKRAAPLLASTVLAGLPPFFFKRFTRKLTGKITAESYAGSE